MHGRPPWVAAFVLRTAVAHRVRFMVDTENGSRAMVDAIEKEVAQAEVPGWPWKPLGLAIRHAPASGGAAADGITRVRV